MIENWDLPLVFFTILSQMAIGLVLIGVTRQWATEDGPGTHPRVEWVTIGLVLAAGVLASLFHLGYPLGAFRSLANLKTAWLSREILSILLFGILVAVILLTDVIGAVRTWMVKVAAVIGSLALVFTAMTYAAPPSLRAINNILPLAFFVLTALLLGTAFGRYFANDKQHVVLVKVLWSTLLVSLVLHLVIPFIWLSGGTVMHLTGQAYLSSPLHWIHVGVGLMAPLLVLWRTRSIPNWLPPLLLIGETAGRAAFFALVASTAGNLGGLY